MLKWPVLNRTLFIFGLFVGLFSKSFRFYSFARKIYFGAMYTAIIVYCKCGVKKRLPLYLLLLLDVTSTNVKDQMSKNLSSPPFYIVGRGRVGVCECVWAW